ncbi:MAG: hypothetical protein ABSE82_13870 [Nitrososphaerales archaeon]
MVPDKPCSALEHLGRSVMGRRYSPKILFAMFTTYFDEAGSDDLGYMFVAGYVASVEAWERFEVDWKLFLAKFDVPYLHMKEFSQSKKCYAKWKDNEPQRGRFLGMAAEIINSHAKRAFLSMVSCKEFGEVDAMFTLSERFKSPYALTGRACIGLANNWARNPKTKLLDIEYVFEDGGPDKGGLISSVEALPPFLPSPAFKPSRDEKPSRGWPQGRRGVVQLQAADYLAYEARKVAFNIVNGRPRIARKSLQALTPVDLERSTWDRARLLRLCQGANFQRRAAA